jgi:protein O-GlcNAc transferase
MTMTTDILPDDVQKERAKSLLGQGRLEEARALLFGLCRDDQRDVEIWFLYSAANAHLSRFAEVAAACRKALEIDPEYLPAMNSLASALAEMGQHAEAAIAFTNALHRAPDNPAVLNNYARALTMVGRIQEARDALENAVRIQPHYAEAHFNLAILLEQEGLASDALREYEQAAALKPGLPGLSDRLTRLRESVGRGA